jgi:hypothetical protein
MILARNFLLMLGQGISLRVGRVFTPLSRLWNQLHYH